MRLIDADALDERVLTTTYTEQNMWALNLISEYIKEAPTIGGWISVKDRPPEFYKEVNVAEHGVFDPWLVTSASLHEDGHFYRGGNIMIDAKFWQPLPEPPKEEG